MKDLSIGMRVRATPSPIPGLRTTWAGLTGEVVGRPGTGDVRVRFDDGREVACGPDDLTPDACEYFTRYGNDGEPGQCGAAPLLELVDQQTSPRIRVCGDHAAAIAARFPNLGGRERFASIAAPSAGPRADTDGEMLPCPFCARADMLVVALRPESRFWCVRCRSCGAIGPGCGIHEGDPHGDREAIATWNRRTGPR